jgi:TPR repeat protein
MYLKGQGVPQDSVIAHMWLNLAAAGGEKCGGSSGYCRQIHDAPTGRRSAEAGPRVEANHGILGEVATGRPYGARRRVLGAGAADTPGRPGSPRPLRIGGKIVERKVAVTVAATQP